MAHIPPSMDFAEGDMLYPSKFIPLNPLKFCFWGDQQREAKLGHLPWKKLADPEAQPSANRIPAVPLEGQHGCSPVFLVVPLHFLILSDIHKAVLIYPLFKCLALLCFAHKFISESPTGQWTFVCNIKQI